MGEAQAEAGVLVANAWQDVRRRVSSGVDRSLVALLERENQAISVPTVQQTQPVKQPPA